MLQTYGSFRPTAFDNAGAFLPERQDWLVCPCMQTRDSDALERSNFTVQAAIVREAADAAGEDETHEEHRFGHWGPGWFEVLIVRPGSKAHEAAEDVARRLESYPLLDEDAASDLEWEEAAEYWADMSMRERYRAIERSGAGCSIFAVRRDELPRDDNGRLFDYLRTP